MVTDNVDECCNYSTKNAISIRGVYKRYGDHIVLNDFNLDIPETCIFGLLGSSGCGKTTLLNCIIDNNRIDIGEIKIKYDKLSDIGLMPQDFALVELLTIKNTLNYFGKLFGMSRSLIKKRTVELVELLELPEINRRVDTLSGGQQRRLSMAVALFHDPKIYILDEPTVGLDSLLVDRIWTYFMTEVRERNKTIIITTHYLEEAKKANYIGFMRQGKIIAYSQPAKILQQYGCDTLEEVFLNLSTKEKSVPKWPSRSTIAAPKQICFKKEKKFDYARFNAQLYKNILFIIREKLFMVFIFFGPLIQCSSLHFAVGNDPNSLKLGIVNDDHYNCSMNLGNCYGQCSKDSISCCYLDYLKRTTTNFEYEYINNIESGMDIVERGRAFAVMYFPKNFSYMIEKRMGDPLHKQFDLTETEIASGDIFIILDASSKIITSFFKKTLIYSFYDYMKDNFEYCGWNRNVASLPFRIEKTFYNDIDHPFTNAKTSSFVMLTTFFYAMSLSPLYILNEKNSGFLPRCFMSGLTILELFAAVFVIVMIVNFIQIIMCFFILYFVYEHPFNTTIWTPLLLSVFTAINGLLFSTLISLCTKSYTSVTFVSNSYLMFLTFSNGFVWPIEGVHPLAKLFYVYSPLNLITDAFGAVTNQGMGLTDFKVYIGIISVNLWSIFFFIIMLIIGFKNGLT